MTDKEKLRQEIETVFSRRLNRLRGEWFELEEETEDMVNVLLSIIFSAPQEPVNELWHDIAWFDKVWHDASEKPKEGINTLVLTKDYRWLIAVYSCKKSEIGKGLWMWADGFPVGKATNGNTMYSSWCELEEDDIDKWAYVDDLSIKKEEPVSEDLKQAIHNAIFALDERKGYTFKLEDMFMAGANWQKEQIMKEAMYDKPTWSKEDENHVDSLLKRLEGLCRNEFERTKFAISQDVDWLKSLKERIGG